MLLRLVVFFSLALTSTAAISKECDWVTAKYQSALEHLEGGQNLLAATQLSALRFTSCSDTIRDQAIYKYGIAAWELGDERELARQVQWTSKIKSPQIMEKQKLLLTFAKHLSESSLTGESKSNFDLWKGRHDQLGYKKLNYKSPLIAGLSSAVIPGVGQAYAGALQSAALAFTINAIFAYATADFFENDLQGAGTASALVFSVTYFGNIFNAATAARKYNEAQRHPLDLQYRKDLIGF